MSTQAGKDVIYIDIDDEITAIIDKVRGAHERIVALVLPKRATVLQSIVNMKLLKRTADEAKKHLVLITNEASLLPLAGNVGIYVAKTLQSKPEIPDVSSAQAEDTEDAEEAVNMADEGDKLDTSRPVGDHARSAPASVVPSALADEEDQPIELDNAAAAPPIASSASKKAGKKGKKFSIPDFNKFRVWLVLGGVGLVLLIFLLYMGLSVMPRASVVVKTDSTALEESIDVTLDTAAKEIDAGKATLPAVAQETAKTFTQQAEATGQKDKGTKASGTIKFYNCNLEDLIAGNDRTIPAGTGVTATGLTFITLETVVVQPSNYNGTTCKSNKASSSVNMVAQSAGEKYNIGATSYSVANYSTITGQGSDTSGGTSSIVKVLTQADIDGAKQKIAAQDTAPIKQELLQGLTAKGMYAIDATFKTADPEVTTSAKVGDEVTNVTVTEKITYGMMGAKQADLKKVIDNAVREKIDPSKQKILDYGLDKAVFKPQNQQGTTSLVTMDVTAVAGSDLDLAEIKKQVAGKKSNDAKEIIGKYPGVTEVKVDYSPFWVSSIPKKTSKITITVQKPAAKNAN